MKRICGRIRKLEQMLAPHSDGEGKRLIELLEARRKRLAEAEGGTYVSAPRQDLSGLTFVEALQQRRNQLCRERAIPNPDSKNSSKR